MSVLINESYASPSTALWEVAPSVLQLTPQVTMNTTSSFTLGTFTFPRKKGIYELEVTWLFQSINTNTNVFTGLIQETSTGASYPIQTSPSTSGAGVVAYLTQGAQLSQATNVAGNLSFVISGTCSNVSGGIYPLGSAIVKITYFPM